MTTVNAKYQLTLFSIYAIAMALLEAVVVVYMRQLYYPENPQEVFPLSFLDSYNPAVELSREIATIVMIIAVVVSVLIMMLFAVPVGNFVNKNPTVQMLGLAFLILIGFMLIAEGAHLGDLVVFDSHVGTVPKGYLYFAIAFSLMVEFLNMRIRPGKKSNHVELNTYAAEEAASQKEGE